MHYTFGLQTARLVATAARMTLITVNAVVDIAGHVVVVEVGCIIPTMAAGALENRIIIGVGMAGRTHSTSVTMRCRKLRVLRMVESRSGPGSGVVAVLARSREELWLRCVARIGRVVVIGLVTPNASRRERRVVVVNVAVRALPRRDRVRSR